LSYTTAIDGNVEGNAVKTCATAGIVGDDEGWVTTPAVSQRLCFARRVSGAVSSSSVGLEEGVLGAASVTTGSTHVVIPLDAFAIIGLFTESIYLVCFCSLPAEPFSVCPASSSLLASELG
jgi:hypothetical protein